MKSPRITSAACAFANFRGFIKTVQKISTNTKWFWCFDNGADLGRKLGQKFRFFVLNTH